jgi:hypothetical protein
MGNHPNKSTDITMQMIIKTAQTAWANSGRTSLLQLNIQKTFDIINHQRLIHILKIKEYPA